MATAVESGKVSQLVQGGIDGQRAWLDQLAERVQGWLSAALESGGDPARRAKDILNGTWLGHALHPALTDVPIGAWFTGAMLDLAGSRRGADTAFTIGVVGAVPAALAGLADWHDQGGSPRRTGLVHALLNSGALVCFVASLLARRSGNRGLGIGLSTAGLTLATGGAYLGGELVFVEGTQVDRNAWAPADEGWHVAARVADLQPDRLAAGEIEVEGQKVPLVLLKRGQRVFALAGTCSHLGGPLAEGTLMGERCVVCPWHGSTFDLENGGVVHGPSAYPQPCYETRQRNGNLEVRLKS